MLDLFYEYTQHDGRGDGRRPDVRNTTGSFGRAFEWPPKKNYSIAHILSIQNKSIVNQKADKYWNETVLLVL